MNIRVAKPRDIVWIADRWAEHLHNMGIVFPERHRVRGLVTQCVSSQMSYVSDTQTGALLARLAPFFWRRGKEAMCLAWFADQGEGMVLLRHFIAQMQRKKGVNRVSIYNEGDADPRIGRVLSRFGFENGGLVSRWN